MCRDIGRNPLFNDLVGVKFAMIGQSHEPVFGFWAEAASAIRT
jgi:hypothetical protein